ncbi:MAG: aldehyde dehydrogenase family protein [Verrucomicrobiae bacterium]|nr:aldehyde dehydrogenase family protein [Verrucomicrobiae bacterium]
MDETSTTSPGDKVCDLFRGAREHFASGATLPLEVRLEGLGRLESAVLEQSDAILAALADDLGKPLLEAWLAEVHFVLSEIRLFRRKLRAWAKPRRVSSPFFVWPARSEIRREPFGTVLVAAPWNYPFQLSLGPLVAALAGGNTVVLKPSELAPATAGILEDLVANVFEPGQVSVVVGGAEIGEALLQQDFDFLFYTGGERVGRLYAEAAARRLAPVVLELGGKSPCLIAEDADLDLVARRLVAAKWFNAGQTCIAPDFVLVPETRRGALVARVVAELEKAYGKGVPVDLAAVVNEAHYQRLLGLVSGEVVQVGEDDPVRRILAPRVLPNTDWDDVSMREEIFGPILPVIGYESLEGVLDRLRKRPDPLALYVFSRDHETLEAIAGAVRSGSVCFNDAMKQAVNLNLPFGGVGASGMGRYRGRAGFETFTWTRAVTRRFWVKDPFLTLPPYGKKGEWMRRWMK